MNNKFVTPVKYWYLVGMSRWENLRVPELWFGSISFYNISIPRAMCLSRKVSYMVYRPKWYQEKKYHQIPIAYWYQKIWNPHYRYLNGIQNIRIYNTGPTLVLISAISFMLTCVYFGSNQTDDTEDNLLLVGTGARTLWALWWCWVWLVQGVSIKFHNLDFLMHHFD